MHFVPILNGWTHYFTDLRGLSAILAFVFAELVEGNGFIAAFFGGLFLGVKEEAIRERMQEFGEAEGLQLS